VLNPKTEPTPPVLPLYPAADHFQVDDRWLRAQALAGRVPCLKVGRRFLFSVEALGRALAEMAATSYCAPGPVDRTAFGSATTGA
jgi:hypothetical protein